MKQRTDIFGREIEVGDYIVYGSGQGGLSWGRVNDIKRKDVDQYNYQTRTVEWVEQVKLRVSVVPYYKDGVKNVTLSESCSIALVEGDIARIINERLDAPPEV